MNCPTCGASYELIYEMGKVASVATIPGCACPNTGNASVPGSFQWVAPSKYTSTSAPVLPGLPPSPFPTSVAPAVPPVPEEPLRPAEEIVDDLRDLLDELDHE